MASKIFINYRREDSIAIAGRLHDRLAEAFGRDNLFMDVDNIPVGINFEEHLKNQVAACDAVLSVIGPNWLIAKDEADQRRIDKPDDFVAIEIAAALARNILVIPVLVDGTRMPKASELPDSLKPLALRNAIQVRNTNFGSDAEQLITKVREALALERPTQGPEPLQASLVAAFLYNICVFLIAVGFFFGWTGNHAVATEAMVAAVPFAWVARWTLEYDESVRTFGLVVCVVGLLGVAAIIVSGQFFGVGLFDPTVQNNSFFIGALFIVSAVFFYQDKQWNDAEPVKPTWWVHFSLFGFMMMMMPTWMILNRLTGRQDVVLALVGVQLLVVVFCYVRYRKALAANPAPS
jgi:TIR domain